MGDSDDEYDRNRRRDKFARERRDYQDPGNRSRDDWRSGDGDRSGGSGGGWNRSRGRDAYGRDAYGRRERYGSPGDRSDLSPPVKRMRGREWGDERGSSYSSSGYGDSYHSHSEQRTSGSGSAGGQGRADPVSDNCPTQPAMLLFKQFLHQLDDEVGDTDAVKKYNEYKMDFKKKQVKEFFRKHKDEEWFKIKYHPDEKPKRESEQQAVVQRRLAVFNELVASGWIDSTAVDVENAEKIIKILDAAVIKLEGGTDVDLQILDQPELEEAAAKSEMPLFAPEVTKPLVAAAAPDPSGEKTTAEDGVRDENSQEATPAAVSEEQGEPQVKPEPADEAATEGNGQIESAPNEDSQTSSTDQPGEKESGAGESVAPEPQSTEKVEEEASGPRPLHRTASIFLRNLPPNITRSEVLDVCRRFNGFLRLAIAEPNVERRFYRRGWATFKCNVSIKDICWQFNAHKFNQTECGAIINRSLNRRIRSVNGIASHKNVIRADIRHAAKIVYNLDKQKGLWIEKTTSEGNGITESAKIRPAFAEESKNPLLQNITDYLIEEANAEEEELLGVEAGELEGDETEQGQALERDEAMIKILDRMLLYLRIVHSVDYYNNTDYPQEDEMPNRIGIMHARGSPPTSTITIAEINEYIKTFEEKIKPYLETVAPVTEEEKKQLGCMTEDAAVDQFVEENTKCVKAEKFECLLEGKKFKAKDFVTKHLKTKHPIQIEEVKKETAYYNNYISDPKRPQLPEHPSNRPQPQTSPASSSGKDAPPGHSAPHPMWPGPYHHPPAFGFYGPPRPPMPGFGMGAGGMGMGGWGPNRNYPQGGMPPPPMNAGGRGVRSYRDLDAPEEW